MSVVNGGNLDGSPSDDTCKATPCAKGLKLKKRQFSRSPDSHVMEAHPAKIPKHVRSHDSHVTEAHSAKIPKYVRSHDSHVTEAPHAEKPLCSVVTVNGCRQAMETGLLKSGGERTERSPRPRGSHAVPEDNGLDPLLRLYQSPPLLGVDPPSESECQPVSDSSTCLPEVEVGEGNTSPVEVEVGEGNTHPVEVEVGEADRSLVEDEVEEDDWGVSFLANCEGLLDEVERSSQLTGEEKVGEELGRSLEPYNLFRVTAVEESSDRSCVCVCVCVRACVWCVCMCLCECECEVYNITYLVCLLHSSVMLLRRCFTFFLLEEEEVKGRRSCVTYVDQSGWWN